jgi:hypothetical protein
MRHPLVEEERSEKYCKQKRFSNTLLHGLFYFSTNEERKKKSSLKGWKDRRKQ